MQSHNQLYGWVEGLALLSVPHSRQPNEAQPRIGTCSRWMMPGWALPWRMVTWATAWHKVQDTAACKLSELVSISNCPLS